MAHSLRLSVVLATYHRAETLRETIRCLVGQDLDGRTAIELIVVDDASPDHTRQVVEEAQASAPFAISYQRNDDNRGPGYTQNQGIRKAQAPLLLLMADDILMSPQALNAHIKTHEANPAPEIAVLGRAIQSPRLTQSLFLRTWDPFRFSAFGGQTEVPYYRFWACNISVKRDFILSGGGFREHRGRAGAAAHEDPELGYRLSQAGLRIIYEPAALGYHYHVVPFDGACQRKYEAGLNFGEFREFVPAPEIPVAYHVLNRRTLRDHWRTYLGPGRQFLPPGDRNPLKLLGREIVREFAFNRVTVPLLWEPLVRAAEQKALLRALVTPSIYRGILFHHFLRGCRDGDRRYGRPLLTRWRDKPLSETAHEQPADQSGAALQP
jgi:glycosyltransferase involved in cell wall biosynthesis